MGTARKPVVLTMSALGAIALLSVGFASWEIRNTAISTPASGSISADTVVDKRLKILDGAGWDDSNGVICFGYSKGDSTYTDNGWLTVSAGSPEEKLSAKYNFRVACPSDKTITTSTIVASDFKANETESNGYWTAATSTTQYIDPSPTFTTTCAKASDRTSYANLDSSMDVYDCSVTITFKWGSCFSNGENETAAKNLNPYIYYNKQTYSDELAEKALTALQAIKNVADNVTFSFTITVSIAS